MVGPSPLASLAHDQRRRIDDAIEALNFGAPVFEEPEFNLRDLLVRRTRTKSYVVHPISRIEDVFTSAERDLLRWLWDRGRPVPNTQRIRLVTGPHGEGARRLATQAGLIYNTFKNLTRALSTKLELDIVKPDAILPQSMPFITTPQYSNARGSPDSQVLCTRTAVDGNW